MILSRVTASLSGSLSRAAYAHTAAGQAGWHSLQACAQLPARRVALTAALAHIVASCIIRRVHDI